MKQARLTGAVSFREIEEAGFSASRESLKGDDRTFEQLDPDVRLEVGKGRFVLRFPDTTWTYETRKEEHKEAKAAIATLAAKMLWGEPEARKKICEQLESNEAPDPARAAAYRILGYLEQYWRKPHRSGLLDAGTTTAAVAENLRGWRTPDPAAGLISLRVLTNCPRIEEILADPKVTTEVISLGGTLRKDTRAHTGPLADQCLAAWNVRLDIGLVGTTSLVTGHMVEELRVGHPLIEGFACDSDDEARTKSSFLHKAGLRCVVMDSTKLERLRSSAFCFAPLAVGAEGLVDLVITDEGIMDKGGHGAKGGGGSAKVNWRQELGRTGIVVLVAPPAIPGR